MSLPVLIVDDEVRYRELYTQVLNTAGFDTRAAASSEEALRMIRSAVPALVVSDVRMPGADGIELLRMTRESHPELPFLLVTAYADVRDAVKALKLGAVDYLTKPVDLDELLAAVRDALGVRTDAPGLAVPPEALSGIVAESRAMRSVLRDAYRVAGSDVNVLLTGESGSGKEVVALFIHQSSPRRDKPMIAVSCAAIPATLLASELFGHEKGAFTGAIAKRQGRFRETDGGTLFLDEIGDMPLEVQPALLRAVETGRITPVGSDKEIEVDYRLVAATNRSVPDDVESGRFRRDLYYRLSVIAIDIPPLRERPEDILPLARHFLARGKSDSKRLSRAAAQALIAHPWPGNVRELANAIEHARLLCQADVILPEHLPPAVRKAAPFVVAGARETPEAQPLDVKTLEESEIETIRGALAKTHGNRTRAAELLGITRRGLIYKLKRLGME
jgi:DNA-binding NtrC family response regulator